MRCAYVLVIKNHSFGRFWAVSWTIAHRFGVPVLFPRLLNPEVRLRVYHKNPHLLPILGRFMDYCSPFWGPFAISMLVEPRVSLMVRSSKLAVLADSRPFDGLLLTVLGPGKISMEFEPRGAC